MRMSVRLELKDEVGKNRKNVNGYKSAILESNLPKFIQKVNIMPLICCHPWQSCS